MVTKLLTIVIHNYGTSAIVGGPSGMPKEPTGTSWSQTTIALSPGCMWSALRAITDYKGRNSSDAQPTASLPDELNTFYAWFEVSNTTPTARLAEDQDDCSLSLTMAEESS